MADCGGRILARHRLTDQQHPGFPRMSLPQDIDLLLREWPFQPGVISARLVEAGDGRQVLQMRIEMGLLQMEPQFRPNGDRPHGKPTYLEYIREVRRTAGHVFRFSDEHCAEIDQEFLQYYHRRICWLALQEFARAILDADHTLALMNFVRQHSTNQQWMLSHEQYRPFVLFHRTQAAALAELERSGPEGGAEGSAPRASGHARSVRSGRRRRVLRRR